MEHMQFKTQQIAAEYVAGCLDEGGLEAFERHLFDCRECLEDVEAWRAIKRHMRPRPARRGLSRNAVPFGDWRIAASLVGVVGAAAAWSIRGPHTSDLDSMGVFNVPTATRSADDCMTIRLATDTRTALLRLPVSSTWPELWRSIDRSNRFRHREYSFREQPDGSYMVRMSYQLLDERTVWLETRGAGRHRRAAGLRDR